MDIQSVLDAITKTTGERINGTGIAHHNSIIWQGQLYTHPDLQPYENQKVNITELTGGKELLITDLTNQKICIAEHVAQAYKSKKLYSIPLGNRPIVQHGEAYTGRGNDLIITADGQVLPIHPQVTKNLSNKQGFYPCIYAACMLEIDGINQPYAHWLTEK